MALSEKLTLKEKLGQILLRKGVINREQLSEVLKIQQEKDKGKFIGEILVNFSYITREELNIALVIQSERPYIQVTNCRITPGVIKSVPREIAKKHRLIPLDKIGNILTLVMVDPLDNAAREEIEKITKCKVKSFAGTADEVEEAILQNYGK